MKTKTLLASFMTVATLSTKAQTTKVDMILLNTIEGGEPWPCLYYELNNNADITEADAQQWYGFQEDESHWQVGVGPFSNDQNRFFINDWASEVRPILIRRHFNLTADELELVKNGSVTFYCSYDENPKVYLNGTQIFTASGWNDNNYATNTFSPSKKKLFVEGDNVLAVSVMRGGGGGHIDLGLTARVSVTEGIINVNDDDNDNDDVYNLSGQRMNKATSQKGIYIVNNKKTIK